MNIRRLAFPIFVVLAVFVFRHDLYHIPGCDQLDVLRTVQVSSSNWNFLYRMAWLPWGDSDLFRPAAHLWIGVTELLFHAHPLAGGLAGIVLHAAAATMVVFLFLDLQFSKRVAFAFGVYFCCPWPGMEMVSWRHIQPYLVFALLCTWAWRRIAREQLNFGTGLILLCAGFFHEVVIYGATLVFVLFLFRKVLFPNPAELSVDRVAQTFLVPALIYFCLRSGVRLAFPHPSTATPFAFAALLTAAYKAVLLMGVGVQLTLWPETLTEFSRFVCRKAWPCNAQTRFSFALFGFALAGLFLTRAKVFLAATGRKTGREFVEWNMFFVYALLSFGLVFFRLEPRGWFYMDQSTYYYYLFSWLMMGMFSVLVTPEKLSGWKSHLLVFFLVLQSGFSVWKIQETNRFFYAEKKAAAHAISSVYRALSANDLCVKEVETDYTPDFLQSLFFAHRLCSRPSNKLKTPTVVEYFSDGPPVLKKLGKPKEYPVTP